jgi:hypothetical protein
MLITPSQNTVIVVSAAEMELSPVWQVVCLSQIPSPATNTTNLVPAKHSEQAEGVM